MTLDYAKHKNIMLQILKEVYSDATLAPHLGFKGGTAAFLFYGLNRDSVDLDFDLLDESKEAEVFEKIHTITENYGTITESRIKHFNLLNVLSYAPGAQKIKVEVNRRNFNSRYELRALFGISMLVMVQEDMFAHKLMAMHERIGRTSRDIYDVWFFLQNNWSINKEIVEQRSKLTYKEFLQKAIEQLEKMNNKHILDGLGDFLTKPQKDWARAKLRTDTIFLLRIMLDNEK